MVAAAAGWLDAGAEDQGDFAQAAYRCMLHFVRVVDRLVVSFHEGAFESKRTRQSRDDDISGKG